MEVRQCCESAGHQRDTSQLDFRCGNCDERKLKQQVKTASKFRRLERGGELGVTMVLVAVAMVAIIAMAAMSIDLVTLYLAREEAQRAADSAALAAARVISVTGITGTASPAAYPGYWGAICGSTTSWATQAALSAAAQ